MYDWFGGLQVRHWWEPITASRTADWRRTHILAHVLGGMVWVVVHGIIAGLLGGPWTLLTHPVGRVLMVGAWQATGWEWTQHENWRPELVVPPSPPGTGYPWLSAGWDTGMAMVGAALFVGLLHLNLIH